VTPRPGRRSLRRGLLGVLLAAHCLAPAGAGDGWTPREGKELLGAPAPEWKGIRWIQGGPLTLAGLRGKVVLLRFWLADCPYCERTAPALRELDSRFRDRGLVVVGIHHAKSARTRNPEKVALAARELGFTFPVGMDDTWATLKAYGVGTVFRRFTSVSFLIDASGTIRFVHDGGEFHAGGGPGHRECNAAYEALQRTIEELLPKAPRRP
jgi:peroxiredoxin